MILEYRTERYGGTSDVKAKRTPLYKKILLPMGILVTAEVLLLIGVIFGSDVTERLNQNALDILGERVINRQAYLQDEMVGNWSKIDLTVQAVQEKVEAGLESGTVSLEDMNGSGSAVSALLGDIVPDLVTVMRNNRVTGAFVVFNTDELTAGGEFVRAGLHFRDMDPTTSPSKDNSDLTALRAPAEVSRGLGFPLDSDWTPLFELSADKASFQVIRMPFQGAYENRGKYMYTDLGYWGDTYQGSASAREVVTYSVPLMLEDGTPYGVLGIELTMDHLKKKVLPYTEIVEDKKGSYLLGVAEEDSPVFRTVLINGPLYSQKELGEEIVVSGLDDSAGMISVQGEAYPCAVEYLNIYNSNTLFSGQRWALIGAVEADDLFAFSDHISNMLLIAIILTLAVGVAGSIVSSKLITRPITALSREMDVIDPSRQIQLPRTGIDEVDRLTASVEHLSGDVIETNNKFSKIIRMASVKIAGFELSRGNGSVFVTDNFFEMFGLGGADMNEMTIHAFEEKLNALETLIEKTEQLQDMRHTIYKIPKNDGVTYVSLKIVEDESKRFGLAEDITVERIKLQQTEHERDHDILTGLINRRAFMRRMEQLFECGGQVLKTAALVMLDLDNLKFLNDTYGHDCGDRYIKCAGECFRAALPKETLVARISGDEFLIFYYGYAGKEQLRKQLDHLRAFIKEGMFILPDNEPYGVYASGGVAWYPDDSRSYNELVRFADFAMYRVKNSRKGEMVEFDLGAYNKNNYMLQNKMELNSLIEKELLEYHFQPIVDARTGEVHAYEALMRSHMPTLKSSPMDILSIAKMERKLYEIERLTLFNSMRDFARHCETGAIQKGCKLFTNSIANQMVSQELLAVFEQEYGEYLRYMVIEVTEEEESEEQVLRRKKDKIREWGAGVALDDYGSGYNSELMLLMLVPDYIKIDRSIVSDIARDSSKQAIVRNIISYAHERNMKIVGEGVETERELQTLMDLGVDYLQGYFLATPAHVPPVVRKEAIWVMRRILDSLR